MKFSKMWLCVLVGLAGLFLMGRHGQALPAAVANNPVATANNKVFIYPTVGEKIEQLQAKGIQNVKNYGSYWLVEASDAQVDQLTKLYGDRAVKENRLNRIQLSDTSFDTASGDPAIPASFREEEGPGKRLRLVQFRGPITPEWLRQIKSVSGTQIISYVPNNAYLVFMDGGTERELEKLHSPSGPIQWIGAYHPYYKIAPELRYVSGTVPIKVRVAVVDRPQEPQEESGVFAMGSTVAELKRNGQQVIEINVEPSDIIKIAHLPDVLWIQKVESQQLLDEVQDLILATQTNGFGNGPSTSIGITNYLDFLTNAVSGGMSSFTNQFAYPVVDVADTGLDGPSVVHPSFYEFGNSSRPLRVVYEEPPDYIDAGAPQLGCEALNFPHVLGPEDFYDHGTLVASVIAGYDVQPNSDDVCIYDVISNQVFASLTPYICTGADSETGMFTFATSPCELVTGILVTCTSPGQEIFETLTLPTEITFTEVVNNVHQDVSGFQFGLGVSPFGGIGVSRIWSQAAHTVGTPPVVVIDPTTFCINSLPSFIASAYGLGARIQNDSWSDELNTDGSNGGQYNPESQIYDVAVRDALLVGASNSNNVPGPSPLNQEFIVVFAANSALGDEGAGGNVGGFGDIRLTAPATAKNVITVGSSDSVRVDGSGCAPANQEDNSLLLPPFTAFGPTLDGRFKPEIVAPGTTIYGARSELALFDDPVNGISSEFNIDTCGNLGSDANTICALTNLFECMPFVACSNETVTYVDDNLLPHGGLYQCNSGSSFAAPAVSGSIQLLWWYFENRLTNEVGQALLQPSPAMAKAYLCNSARYLPITNPQTQVMDTLPSSAQGMGELDLLRMFDGMPRAIRDESSPRAIDSPLVTTNPAPQQTYFSQSGQSYELKGLIASNGLPFRVTLAWTDAAGAPNANGPELVNNLDLQVIINGVTYKGNVFAQNVSVPGGAFDAVNNMESVFLNPVGMLGGIAAVTSGAPWQVIVRATDIVGNGVPNVGGALNQDFALVVYNAATNTLSDVPNLATNNSCQTAMDLLQFPLSFTNTLSNAVYANVQPSPSVATGGSDEFFKIPQPTPGTTFNIDTFGSGFDTVLSVWSVQVLPQTIFVRGDCGALTEVVANNDAAGGTNGLQSQVTFTADGSNDYFIVVEPHNDGPGGQMILNVKASQSPITVSPTNLAFGAQIEGTTSAVQTVTYNNGASVSVDISQNPTVTGPNAGDFLILSQTCGFDTINPGTNCFVVIAFAPTTVGPEQANLVFVDNATGSPRIVPLSGIGTPAAPVVCLSTPGPLIFPSQLVTTTSAVQTVTILNCGSTNLNVASVSVTGFGSNDFIVTQNCISGSPIAPGNTCSLNVAFAPQSAGTRQATLTVTDDSGNPSVLLLQGVGNPQVPSVCFGSSPVSFGTVFVGSTSSVQSVVITNCGTAPLIISSVTPSGADAGDFPITSSSCSTVAPGGTCSISVIFAPTVSGVRTATLTVNDNTTSSPDLVSLTGIGSGINCPTITVNPTTLPAVEVGIPYNQTLTAIGAMAPVTFVLAIGPMPPGLSLSSTGVISGTPTKSGQFSFEVGLTDANSCSAEKLYTVFVSCPTINISPNTLPNGTEFSNYVAQTFIATGGTPPYTFAQTAGALPMGMMISSNGVLSGTPTSVSSTFTVTVTDSNNCSASKIYTLTLVDPGPPVSFTPTNLVAGVVGQSYSNSFVASGGSGSGYSFTNSAGALPPGLSLSAAGVFSGKPTSAGTFSFAIVATDSLAATATNSYTMNITSIADLAVSSSLSLNPVTVNSNLTCSVIVTNLGPSPATGVIVSNSLPAGASFVSASSGCAAVGDLVVCNVGSIAAGTSVSVSYTMTLTAVGSISVTTTVTANETDSNHGNNTAVANGSVSPPFTIASNPKAITDVDGDIVSITLKGPGGLEVHLLGGADTGPINSIVLTNTDASSSLTIKVKRVSGGDGLVNIGSIIGSGSLKSISGKDVNITGAGIQLGGGVGTVTINALTDSSLTVGDNIKTVTVKTFTASTITAAQVGSVKIGTIPSTSNGGQEFGVVVQEAAKGTVTVSNPRLKWKIATSPDQFSGDFHVKY